MSSVNRPGPSCRARGAERDGGMTAEVDLDLGREVANPPRVPDGRGKDGFRIADIGGHLLHHRRFGLSSQMTTPAGLPPYCPLEKAAKC